MGEDAQGPLCDECFGMVSDHPNPELDDLCEECQEAVKQYCFCCGTGGHKKLDEDGLCDECLEDAHTIGGD